MTPGSSVDAADVARFSALGADWWSPTGSMRALHEMNPLRLAYIAAQARKQFGSSLEGLRLLDIGCGGGILSEPLARMGAVVTGIDPSERTIAIARQHAAAAGIGVAYRATSAEAARDQGETFDMVLAMEVVEHAADMPAFLRTACDLARPGGLIVLSTINRTAKSFALAIVGAEYVLRLLPAGTHHWEQFVTPDELSGALRAAGARPLEPMGARYNPLLRKWRETRDTDVNYLMAARKPG